MMKKTFVLGISVTLLILVASITGCAPVNSQETIDIIKDYGDTVQIEVIERKDHPNIHLGDKEYRVDTPTPTETPEIIDGFKVEEGLGTEEVVVPIDTISPTPDIWETTMENWGDPTPAPSETPAPTPAPAQLFTEVSAIKYTNTSANLRDTYSTSGKKVTTLPLNTEINVIGTGIPDTEAAGWSKIQFNGKEAYISSSLLSDYKIEIQQQKPTGQQSAGQQPAVSVVDQSFTDPDEEFSWVAPPHEVDTSKEQVTIESQGHIKQ